MKKEELTIRLKTLTPIWTGDALGESNEIKSQSIYGGLRYWFELYCKSVAIAVKNFGNEELDKKIYIKEMDNIIKSQNNLGIDEAKKLVLNNCGITLTSQLFGCKGLKGDLEISNINSDKKFISKNNIDFKFLNRNIGPWMKRTLFSNTKNLECHLDLVLKVKLSHYYVQEFKKFLKYYEDKIILIGGKKSIGFGFAKLTTDDILTDTVKIKEKNQTYVWDKIELTNKDTAEDKEILGFSFKYFIRKKECKCYRKDNFGKKGQGSRFYFSNVVRESNKNYVYIIGFLEGTHKENTIFKSAFKKYLGWIKEVK